jgi:hypothetical protein
VPPNKPSEGATARVSGARASPLNIAAKEVAAPSRTATAENEVGSTEYSDTSLAHAKVPELWKKDAPQGAPVPLALR